MAVNMFFAALAVSFGSLVSTILRALVLRMKFLNTFVVLGASLILGCAGMKVIHPNDKNENEGTLAVDWTGGKMQLVGTFTCKLESMGNRFSAVGKTVEEAQKEVLARCQDRTLLSFCKAENIKCIIN